MGNIIARLKERSIRRNIVHNYKCTQELPTSCCRSIGVCAWVCGIHSAQPSWSCRHGCTHTHSLTRSLTHTTILPHACRRIIPRHQQNHDAWSILAVLCIIGTRNAALTLRLRANKQRLYSHLHTIYYIAVMRALIHCVCVCVCGCVWVQPDRIVAVVVDAPLSAILEQSFTIDETHTRAYTQFYTNVSVRWWRRGGGGGRKQNVNIVANRQQQKQQRHRQQMIKVSPSRYPFAIGGAQSLAPGPGLNSIRIDDVNGN